MPTLDKAKEDDGEQRIFPKVESGITKNKGQGTTPRQGNQGQSKGHMHPRDRR